MSNGNNQYTGKRVGNNFLPKEIKSFKSKQEIADAFELTTRTLNDYQSLARNGIEELETIVENGKIKKFVYKKSGKTCTYTKDAKNGTDGAYDVAK